MKIPENVEIIRKGFDVRKAEHLIGVYGINVEEESPFDIVPDESEGNLTLEISGIQFPYLYKTVNRDGSEDIHDRAVYGMRIIPLKGRINKIILNSWSTIALHNLTANQDGLSVDLADNYHVEIFFEPITSLEEIPPPAAYKKVLAVGGEVWYVAREQVVAESVIR